MQCDINGAIITNTALKLESRVHTERDRDRDRDRETDRETETERQTERTRKL